MKSYQLHGSRLSDEQLRSHNEDGYLLIEGLLSKEEVALTLATAKENQRVQAHTKDVVDKAGRNTRLSIWNQPSEDIFGMIARSEILVNPMEQILGDEVYHYHSKVMMKEPHVGGAWEWHQDYGYWYKMGCLLPDLASCLIALDRASRANGCLQVIRGSHKMGRVEHGVVGSQAGADMERVNIALERMELEYAEMEPGSALFFHSNLLHKSDANLSEFPRWSLICCYNARSNDPYTTTHHSNYTPLAKVPRTAILEAGKLSVDS